MILSVSWAKDFISRNLSFFYSNICTQFKFREKIQRKGIQSDAKLFNEYFSLGLPMFVEGAIAFLIENSPSVVLALGQHMETGPVAPASRGSKPPDGGRGFVSTS